MRTKSAFVTTALGFLFAWPVLAQFPTPLPEPDPDPDPGGCIGVRICPQRAPDRTVQPRQDQHHESAPQASLVSPMPFFAVGTGNGDHSSSLYRFSLWGAITDFVDYGELGVVLFDVAYGSSPSGPLYAIGENRNLYRYDFDTGTFSVIGNTGRVINALDWCNGVLYGWGSSTLVRINPATAQTTVVGSTGFTSQGDLLCSYGSALYGIARMGTGNDRIVLFNTTTGAATWTGITLPGKEFFAGEIDGEGRMLVGRQTTSQIEIYHVDLASGASSFVGSYPTTLGLYGLSTFPTTW
jgi:hypothetical protein